MPSNPRKSVSSSDRNVMPSERPLKRHKSNSQTPTPNRIQSPAESPAEPPVGDFDSPAPETQDSGFDATLPAAFETEIEKEYTSKYKLSEKGTYTSSIYVDAFNLALDTVLKEEVYLFDEKEQELFAKFRSLDYEAQHLYVRLFLRKTDAWFRIEKLSYPKDISDIEAACKILQSEEVGFADKDEKITLEEAANLLSMEELKLIAKDAKIAGGNKPALISGLKKAATAQTGLRVGNGQLQLSFNKKGNYVNRSDHFLKRILKKTGPCIRLSSPITTLFNRVHLVFYRSTLWTEKSLTTVILSRTLKRNFPSYIVSRTSSIFPSRQHLLDFETAIKLQSTVDELLERPNTDALKQMRQIFEETYPIWQALVQQESQYDEQADQDQLLERVYLRRFTAAWVYTRIIHKGIYVLGRFKEHSLEHSVLCELLGQKHFQSARRGDWYQRKALIEENYMWTLDPAEGSKEVKQKKWRQIALATCEQGLQDPGTHIIFHYDLQKRLLKLESRLKVPKRDQHDFGHASLKKPSERTIFGTRVNTPELGRKTLWLDPEDGKGECSVEEMCLSNYRKEGWKGYHCEGGLVRTLFAYLFYDILFLYLPNVFQTEFQTAPLDLFTDAFYPARASEINHRLVEIENGQAKRIIREVWERERERETSVVGLNWSYDIGDLEEVVECFPNQGLAMVCKVLCQEYRHRGGGMPDLFLWRPAEEGGKGKGEVLFSEVKSENDRLSDTQRMWIHVLTSAGVTVELCAAREKKESVAEEEVTET